MTKEGLPDTGGHVSVSLLDGGSMTASYHKLHAGWKPESFRMYDWVFYIYNENKNQRILWDLGMSSDKSLFTPFVLKWIWDEVQVTGPQESLGDQLQRRQNVSAKMIDTVIFSHAHFDHCRPLDDTFSNATAYFGPGTKEFCSPGHFVDPASQWDGRFFDPVIATEKWETLAGPWIPFGPFDRAMDFFGDASFWIIQAPGHMPGNLCACAHLGDGNWVLLGSDCCHSRALLDGREDFATFEYPDGSPGCLQWDVPAAKDTIARIKIMEQDMGVHVALAHDISWMMEDSNQMLLSLLDAPFLDAIRERCPLNKIL